MTKLLWILAAILLPEIAFADIAQSDLTLQASDKSKILFFDLLAVGETSSPLAGVLSVFNSAVLIVGGLIAGYTIFAGTLNTANDGELLGRKWSGPWLPIRTALGSALILPVFNGFCAMQMLVIWLAMQGSALANLAWNEFATTYGNSTKLHSVIQTERLFSVAVNMLNSNVCHQVIAAKSAQMNSMGATDPSSYGIVLIKSPSEIGYKYGVNQAQLTPDGEALGEGATASCGAITLEVFEPADRLVIGNDADASSIAELQSDMNTMGQQVWDEQLRQFSNLQTKMAEAAQKFLTADVDPSSAIEAAVNEYRQGMEDKVASIYSRPDFMDNFKAALANDGWLYAGSWYMRLSQIQNQIGSLVSQAPEVRETLAGKGTAFDEEVAAKLGQLSATIKNNTTTGLAFDYSAEAIEAEDVGKAECGIKNLGGCITNATLGMAKNGKKYIREKVSNALMAPLNKFMEIMSEPNDPIILAQGFGNGLIAVGWSIPLGLALFAFFIGNVSLAPMAIAFSLWVVGATLSVLIPLAPYALWLGCVVGWMVLVVEALIGAPLWALAHIHPDSDGVVGRAGQGYMLVLSLTLRPTLMVLGLVSALVLIYPFGYLLNATFATVFRTSVGNAALEPITFIAGLVVYAGLLLTLIKKSFSLVYLVPDNILQWLGTNLHSPLGQTANEVQGSTLGLKTNLEGMALRGREAISGGRLGGGPKGGSMKPEKNSTTAGTMEKVSTAPKDFKTDQFGAKETPPEGGPSGIQMGAGAKKINSTGLQGLRKHIKKLTE